MATELPPLDVRIPKWDIEDLIPRACPICGSVSPPPRFRRPDGLFVGLCGTCYTYFVSPAPSERQLASFYSTYDRDHRLAGEVSPKGLARAYRGIDPLADLKVRELSSLMAFRGAKVLDVGFGRAFLLHCFKQLGATPYGVELDGKAVEYARSLGIENVFQGTLDDLPEGVRFDLVSMKELVEHPLDPMALIERACGLLKEGGLLMIYTPNGGAAEREEHPTTFRIDLEHMQYFTMETCGYLARRLNFRIVHLETLGFPILKDVGRSVAESRRRLRAGMVKLARSCPGFAPLNRARRRWANNPAADERRGVYKLFCILQKPD
jgi:2-polyprenyl-3-methyl-5-hydroxy-6-metoxy-1,4-benzoquinol methylase